MVEIIYTGLFFYIYINFFRMRTIIFFFLLVALPAGNANAQAVTLKQIGEKTVMFSTKYVEWFKQHIYTIENTGALYKTDLITGIQTRLGNVTYTDTRFLFVVSGQLYCMENDGSMNRIDINTGAWTVVSPIGTWKQIDRVLVVGKNFYTTQNGVLYYHPTMSDRVRKQIGDADFYELGNYSKTDTSLHTLIGGSLYNINMNTGKWTMIGPKRGWKSARFAGVIGNKFYTIESPSSLFETDLSTGVKKQLDDKQFTNAELIFFDSGKLYGIFKPGILYEIILN
jgi:hypothetical protein